MVVTAVQALTNYFNTGDGKRPTKDWRDEIQAFTPEERRALAEQVCKVTGDTLAAKAA